MMKRHLPYVILPVILSCTVMLYGCVAATEISASGASEKRMVLSEDTAKSESAAYAPENPAIDSAPFFSGGASQDAAKQDSDEPVESKEKLSEKAVKSVWVSYLDLAPMLTGKTEAEFTLNIASAFDNVKGFGLNTVFVHVRPFGDALYESDYFPWSYLASGAEGVAPGYDPLEIMVSEAKKRGLRIEAWINPYRVRSSGSDKILSAANPALIWLDSGHDGAIRYGGVISYNPANAEARELIINGVREIVRNYGVDGVHIDDYFYPHTDAAFDTASYGAYQKGGGKLSLENWRRENVLTMIREMYAAIKEERPDAFFGISPQSSLSNNYNTQYIDMEEITSKPGYCDYVCPQVYFGFENAAQPFAETLETWDSLIKTDTVTMYAGLAVYKAGLPDGYAGDGKAEWQLNDDLLQRMVECAMDMSSYGGFSLYRYDSLFNPAAEARDHIEREMYNLSKIMD